MSNSLSPSPSPDSSSPPSSYRPFSHLPTELVQHIIESAVPHLYDSTTYTTRQATLRSLCLVSRLFRQIAQPLLFAVVEVRTQEDWIKLHSSRAVGMGVWPTIEFALTASAASAAGIDFESSIVQYTALKVLAVSSSYSGDATIDLGVLALLANLQTLRLYNLHLDNEHSAQLATVTELQLLQVSTPDLTCILSPTTFPALRALAYAYNGYDDNPTLSVLLTRMAHQLHVLSLDANSIPHLLPQTVRAIDHFTLFDVNVEEEEDLPTVQNIRLINSVTEHAVRKTLDRLSDSISETSPHRLLYLPPSLKDLLPNTDFDPALDELEEAFRQKEVEIVYEEQPSVWQLDSCISQDFWRRKRMVKVD